MLGEFYDRVMMAASVRHSAGGFQARGSFVWPEVLVYFSALQAYRAGKRQTEAGEVAEWSNALDSKSSVRLWRTVGSNPTLSAMKSST